MWRLHELQNCIKERQEELIQWEKQGSCFAITRGSPGQSPSAVYRSGGCPF